MGQAMITIKMEIIILETLRRASGKDTELISSWIKIYIMESGKKICIMEKDTK